MYTLERTKFIQSRNDIQKAEFEEQKKYQRSGILGSTHVFPHTHIQTHRDTRTRVHPSPDMQSLCIAIPLRRSRSLGPTPPTASPSRLGAATNTTAATTATAFRSAAPTRLHKVHLNRRFTRAPGQLRAPEGGRCMYERLDRHWRV